MDVARETGCDGLIPSCVFMTDMAGTAVQQAISNLCALSWQRRRPRPSSVRLHSEVMSLPEHMLELLSEISHGDGQGLRDVLSSDHGPAERRAVAMAYLAQRGRGGRGKGGRAGRGRGAADAASKQREDPMTGPKRKRGPTRDDMWASANEAHREALDQARETDIAAAQTNLSAKQLAALDSARGLNPATALAVASFDASDDDSSSSDDSSAKKHRKKEKKKELKKKKKKKKRKEKKETKRRKKEDRP